MFEYKEELTRVIRIRDFLINLDHVAGVEKELSETLRFIVIHGDSFEVHFSSVYERDETFEKISALWGAIRIDSSFNKDENPA